MKLTKQEVELLLTGSKSEAVQKLTGSKLLYNLFKNMKKISDENEAIQSSLPKPSDEWKKFQNEKSEEFNKIPPPPNRSKQATDYAFDIFIKSFKAVNEKLFEERFKQLDEVNKIMSEEIELDILTVSESDLPKDLSFDQMRIIEFMVE